MKKNEGKEGNLKRGRKALYNEPSVKRYVVLPQKLVEVIEGQGSLSLYLAQAATVKAKKDKLL